jgi:hypothetical protein
MEIKGTNNKVCKVFSSFEKIQEVYDYINLFEPYHKHFYEIIIGSKKQKPHFDIDLDSRDPNYIKYHNDEDLDIVNSKIVKSLVDTILLVDPFAIIKTYTSNSNNKRSTHVIIINYHHDNNIEANDFYNIIIDNIDVEYSTFIDKSVYKSIQQFRLLGCCKIDTTRVKICSFETKMSEFETFKQSMISNVEEDSTKISVVLNSKKIIYRIKNLITNNEIDEILERFVKDVPDIKRNFKVTQSKNNIITLRRQRPSFCKQCNRVHEHENPFIIKRNDVCYFYCRRGNKPLLNTLFNDIINDKEDIPNKKTVKFGLSKKDDIDDDILESFNLKLDIGI